MAEVQQWQEWTPCIVSSDRLLLHARSPRLHSAPDPHKITRREE